MQTYVVYSEKHVQLCRCCTCVIVEFKLNCSYHIVFQLFMIGATKYYGGLKVVQSYCITWLQCSWFYAISLPTYQHIFVQPNIVASFHERSCVIQYTVSKLLYQWKLPRHLLLIFSPSLLSFPRIHVHFSIEQFRLFNVTYK